MHDILNNIRAPYEDALRGFLKGTGEEALQRAYDLGRRAAEDGVGTLDMVKLHEEVLHTILKDSQRSEALADTVRRASQFFAESLSPYEMTHRGFQEALQTLRVRADELADMNRMLEDEISERTEVERALRESENRFRTLVETARDVIFTLSLHGRITSMNPAFEDLVGAQRTEWIDRSCVTLLHTDDTPRAIRVFQQVLRGEIPATFEARIRTNHGTYLVGEFIMAPQYQDGKIVGALGIARDITERKRASEDLRTLAQRVVVAQEEERKRISRELHDDICQRLSATKLHLEALQDKVRDKRSPLARGLVDVRRSIGATIKEVRSISANLRPATLDDLGLPTALRLLCREFSKMHDITVRVEADPLPMHTLPAQTETAVYRVTQEALSNVAKHSRAREVYVQLRRTGTSVSLTIRDNGKGFDTTKAFVRSDGTGLGLFSMRERAQLASATFDLTSVRNKGTTLKLDIPTTGP